MAEVRVTNINQLEPITSTVALVRIQFTVLGILPDVVQVYARGASDNSAVLRDSVDISSPENRYTSDIQLIAGNAFLIQLCPRSLTDGVPDDQIDGQDWQAFCSAAVPFTTRALSPNPTSRPKPAPPRINSIEPHQATLHDQGKIIVRWTANTNFDQYHFMWMEKPNGRWTEVEIDSAGTSGFWPVAPAFQGRGYSFKVQGCITHTIGLNDCSDFTATTDTVMPQNTHSLREFLRLSQAQLNPGIRSLGTLAISSGLRAMLRV